ncbi:MAG: elongation factor 1-beta [Thermoprotei archaeon]
MAAGKVVVVGKIYPKSVETDRAKLLDEVKQKLQSVAEIKKVDEEPIAFGLVALRVHMVVPENLDGGTEVIESLVSSLDSVSNIEIEYVYRL